MKRFSYKISLRRHIICIRSTDRMRTSTKTCKIHLFHADRLNGPRQRRALSKKPSGARPEGWPPAAWSRVRSAMREAEASQVLRLDCQPRACDPVTVSRDQGEWRTARKKDGERLSWSVEEYTDREVTRLDK